MKRFVFLVLMIFSFYAGHAQTDKGDFILSGSGYLTLPIKNSFAISVSPGVGYFIMDNLLEQPYISYFFTVGEFNRRTRLGIGPLIRYYFPFSKERIKYFDGIYFTYAHETEVAHETRLPSRNTWNTGGELGFT